MAIRIIRVPALDAALARFDRWWGALSRRERVMVGGLGIVLAGLVLVYGVIKPLQAARAKAYADIRTYETLSARIRAAGVIKTADSAPAASQRTGEPLTILNETSVKAGLIADVAPVPNGGGWHVTVNNAAFDDLIAWIADISRTTSLKTRHVQVTRLSTPGRVAATLDFTR